MSQPYLIRILLQKLQQKLTTHFSKNPHKNVIRFLSIHIRFFIKLQGNNKTNKLNRNYIPLKYFLWHQTDNENFFLSNIKLVQNFLVQLSWKILFHLLLFGINFNFYWIFEEVSLWNKASLISNSNERPC